MPGPWVRHQEERLSFKLQADQSDRRRRKDGSALLCVAGLGWTPCGSKAMLGQREGQICS